MDWSQHRNTSGQIISETEMFFYPHKKEPGFSVKSSLGTNSKLHKYVYIYVNKGL